MTADTSPEALAALDLRLIARLVHHRDFDIEDARDVIAALEAERDELDALRESLQQKFADATGEVVQMKAERYAALALLESDAPDGRRVTNAQYVEVTSRLRDERDAALFALEKYGDHRWDCAGMRLPGEPCTCGFDAALAEVTP